MAGIGPATSPLPRECSATEPHGPNQTGAGEGDRTLVVSLENFCSTIELHPQALPPKMASDQAIIAAPQAGAASLNAIVLF